MHLLIFFQLDSDEPDVDDKEDEPDFYTEALLPG